MDLKKTLKFLKLNEQTITMILGALVILVIVFVGYRYFKPKGTGSVLPPATNQTQTSPAEEGKVPSNLPGTVKVEKGETLWSIAQKHYGSGYNWTDIAQANNLKNPGAIRVGQELKLPSVESKKSTGELAPVSPSPSPTSQLSPTSPIVSSTPALSPAPSSIPTTPRAIQTETYVVVRGDSLWKIAVRAYGDGFGWVKIWHANKKLIDNHPNLIYPGQSLTIPRAPTK